MKEATLVIIGLSVGALGASFVLKKHWCKKAQQESDKAWNDALEHAHNQFKQLLSYGAQMNWHPSVILKQMD